MAGEQYDPVWTVGGQPSLDAPWHNMFLNYIRPATPTPTPQVTGGLATQPAPTTPEVAKTSALGGFSFANLFKDPNFHGFLAGLSASLDPEGPGGAVGRAASGLIRNKAAQSAFEKQEAENKTYRDEVLNVLKKQAGITPREKEGITKVEATPEGYKLDITTKPVQVGEGTVLAPTAEQTVAPQAQATPSVSAPKSPRIDLASILPLLIGPGVAFSPGSLAGLGPEDIATIANASTNRQAVMARSIGQVVEAANVQSEIEERAARRELTLEQIKDIQTFRDPTLKKLAAELQVQLNLADKYKADADSTRSLLQPTIDNIRSEIATRKGHLDIEARRLAQQAAEAQARIGESQANRQLAERRLKMEEELHPYAVTEAEKKSRGFVDIKGIPGLTPDEKPTATTGQVLDYLSQGATRQEARNKFLTGMAEKEADNRRVEIDKAREAEKKLLTLRHKPGVAKSTGGAPAEFQSDYQTFHQYSDDPYVYIERKPGSWYNPFGENARFERFPIPVINGKQYTARDIWDAAQAKQIDIPTFMEQYIYKELGQKPPWAQ